MKLFLYSMKLTIDNFLVNIRKKVTALLGIAKC